MSQKFHLCLTEKQIKAIVLSLRSTAFISTTEKRRAYLKKIVREIQEQEGTK